MADEYGVSDMTGQPEQAKADKDLPAYRYAKALREQAVVAAAKYTTTFRKNWDYTLGKEHHQMPATAMALIQDEWRTKSVDNLLFAAIDNKAAVIKKSELAIHIEDLDDSTDYYTRLLISERLRQEAERLKWRRIRDDMFLQGSVTGVGIVMTTVKPDPLTGKMQIHSQVMKSENCFPDAAQDNIHDCGYFVWEEDLPMPVLRQMFPTKAKEIKPDLQRIGQDPGGITYSSSNNDDNLIYGNSGEFIVDSQSQLKARKAKVCFVWINDVDSIVEELKETVIKEESPGYQCTECSLYHDADAVPEDNTDCPGCGAPLVEAMVPAKLRKDTVIRRAYPYGRLIVYSGETLLFDGENPLDIEGCFPFAVYHHYRVPGCFYGFSDTALLWSNQSVRDITIGQGVDYIRLGVNGPFEYPIGAKAYGKLGNAPNQPVPVPDHLCGKANYKSPQNFNVQAWQSVLASTERSFQVVSGFSDLAVQFAGSPHPSATAVEETAASAGGRLGGHAFNMEDAMSDWLSHVYQLLHQHQDEEVNTQVRFPDGSRKGVPINVQNLPKNVRIRVSVNSQEVQKDKNAAQNIAKVAEAMPNLIPRRDLMLALGIPLQRVKEIEDQKNLEAEMQAMAPSTAPPPAIPPAPVGV